MYFVKVKWDDFQLRMRNLAIGLITSDSDFNVIHFITDTSIIVIRGSISTS
jgi:hypothetical protein